MLTISPEKVCYILVKAREFDAKVPPAEESSGSNPSDDLQVDVLEDFADDPTQQELVSAIVDLNEDEKLDLLALLWIGRGDFTVDEWERARQQAADMRHKHVARYVLGTPLASDYLAEGLNLLGYDCADTEERHL